jgi:broad specificity phosphatase PhoE
MTATFFLVRHAAHDNVGGFLAGRTPGIRLGADGRAQAARLAQRLKRESFEAIYASPLERAEETAEAISTASRVPVERAAALNEVDFGSWSNKSFDELDRDPAWRRWNEWRSLARTPAGETMLDVQRRVIDLLLRLRDRKPDAVAVLVSHADVIRAAIGHVLGLSIDSLQRFEISPGSVSTLLLGDWGGRLLSLNEVVV